MIILKNSKLVKKNIERVWGNLQLQIRNINLY